MTASVEEWKRRYETARLAHEEARAEIERLRVALDADGDTIADIERLRAEAADEIERLRALLNQVRIWMKNIDRRESEEPLYEAICRALDPSPN